MPRAIATAATRSGGVARPHGAKKRWGGVHPTSLPVRTVEKKKEKTGQVRWSCLSLRACSVLHLCFFGRTAVVLHLSCTLKQMKSFLPSRNDRSGTLLFYKLHRRQDLVPHTKKESWAPIPPRDATIVLVSARRNRPLIERPQGPVLQIWCFVLLGPNTSDCGFLKCVGL